MGATNAPTDAATGPHRGPVVLELFTSQGCSTCPPADRVLSHLGLDEKTRAKVVPLAFHVDYWNRIGWTDPFSRAQWSERQATYGRALGLQDVYTPQLVVGGRVELNGSQESRALAEIEADLAHPDAARVSLTAQVEPGPHPKVTLVVSAEVLDAPSPAAGKLSVLVALFENGLVTGVERGENSGHTLHNDFVVRHLETAFALEPRVGASGKKAMVIPVRREWTLENLAAVAFAQDARSMRIYGAAVPAGLGGANP